LFSGAIAPTVADSATLLKYFSIVKFVALHHMRRRRARLPIGGPSRGRQMAYVANRLISAVFAVSISAVLFSAALV
jgi:Rad3-related DNA helicase